MPAAAAPGQRAAAQSEASVVRGAPRAPARESASAAAPGAATAATADRRSAAERPSPAAAAPPAAVECLAGVGSRLRRGWAAAAAATEPRGQAAAGGRQRRCPRFLVRRCHARRMCARHCGAEGATSTQRCGDHPAAWTEAVAGLAAAAAAACARHQSLPAAEPLPAAAAATAPVSTPAAAPAGVLPASATERMRLPRQCWWQQPACAAAGATAELSSPAFCWWCPGSLRTPAVGAPDVCGCTIVGNLRLTTRQASRTRFDVTQVRSYIVCKLLSQMTSHLTFVSGGLQGGSRLDARIRCNTQKSAGFGNVVWTEFAFTVQPCRRSSDVPGFKSRQVCFLLYL